MGTPDFAVPALASLLRLGDEIVGVVTQPDRPKGRGRKLTPPPIKVLCQRENLPVLQPTTMKDPEFLSALQGWNAEVVVVVAFGRILPQVLLGIPSRGCLNVHGSLLPKYRGAGPIQWAILNGETETGITIMQMDAGMDTGNILLQERVIILPQETAGELSVRLADVGATLLMDALRRLQEGTLTSIPQDGSRATPAPLLKKEDGLIDWKRPAVQLMNQVRGMSPWPGAYTFASSERWGISRAEVSGDCRPEQVPGMVIQANQEGIGVATGAGVLVLREIQPSNSRRMTVGQYVAGHSVSPGLMLGPESQAEHKA